MRERLSQHTMLRRWLLVLASLVSAFSSEYSSWKFKNGASCFSIACSRVCKHIPVTGRAETFWCLLLTVYVRSWPTYSHLYSIMKLAAIIL